MRLIILLDSGGYVGNFQAITIWALIFMFKEKNVLLFLFLFAKLSENSIRRQFEHLNFCSGIGNINDKSSIEDSLTIFLLFNIQI